MVFASTLLMLGLTCDKCIAIIQQQEMLASVEREVALIAEVRVASPTHCGWVALSLRQVVLRYMRNLVECR